MVENIPVEIIVKSEIKNKNGKKERNQDKEKRKNFELGFRIKLWVRRMGHLVHTDKQKTTYLAKPGKLTVTGYLEAHYHTTILTACM